MHVSWGWIKQRPQFIAEELAKDYYVDVYYRKSNNTSISNPTINDSGNLKINGFRSLPLERIPFLPMLFKRIINKFLFNLNKIEYNQYDYIWITNGEYYNFFDASSIKAKIIYDCMDDAISFPYAKKYPKFIKQIKKDENRIITRADYVFFTAKHLRNTILNRYSIDRETFIVNNAITEDIFTYDSNKIELPPNSFTYIGTISEWMDFELLIEALNKFPDINIIIYGPKRIKDVPQHPRLFFKGSINHNQTISVMRSSIGMIMPFIINDLILSVNPVKLYEYVYSCKPVASVKYGETEYFKNYIYLYSNKEEFFEYIRLVLNDSIKVTRDSSISFVRNNTWTKRVEYIKKIISNEKL